MNITYTQNGDYLIPNIVIRTTKPLGHYGIILSDEWCGKSAYVYSIHQSHNRIDTLERWIVLIFFLFFILPKSVFRATC